MTFFSSFAQANSNQFSEQYRCYPISFAPNKAHNEQGDKIILPQSAFQKLATMEVTYPLQFELSNDYLDPPRSTHVGVLEFTAPEGRCYIPNWVLQNLHFYEANSNGSVGIVRVTNVSLQLARFVKFKPRSVDFLDISNHRAVLESTLRNFSCVTKGDEICLKYNEKNYYLLVLEVEPNNACSIVEADVNVDFEAPDGYVEPAFEIPSKEVAEDETSEKLTPEERQQKLEEVRATEEKARENLVKKQVGSFIPFAGSGSRVDGKIRKTQVEPLKTEVTQPQLREKRISRFSKNLSGRKFQGKGHSLK